jgi:hypothetical protein
MLRAARAAKMGQTEVDEEARMSSEPAPSPDALRPRRPAPSWLYARPFWAGLSILTMWVAVLFVGVFGGNIVSSSASGTTSIPVVVAMLPFVLPATIVVARRGLGDRGVDAHQSPDDSSAAEPSALRSKLA